MDIFMMKLQFEPSLMSWQETSINNLRLTYAVKLVLLFEDKYPMLSVFATYLICKLSRREPKAQPDRPPLPD